MYRFLLINCGEFCYSQIASFGAVVSQHYGFSLINHKLVVDLPHSHITHYFTTRSLYALFYVKMCVKAFLFLVKSFWL